LENEKGTANATLYKPLTHPTTFIGNG